MTTTTTTTTAIDFKDIPEKTYEDVKKETSILKLTEAPKDIINMQDFLKKYLTVEDKNGAPLELSLKCAHKGKAHNNAELDTLRGLQQAEQIEQEKPKFRNLYMGLNKSFFVIDFDGVKEHGDITFSEFWKLPNLPAFVHKLPYTKSRGCGLPHFILRTDIDLQERHEKKWTFKDRYVNCFKDFAMDILLRCTWESTYSQIYNYHGEIPLIPWTEIQQSIDCDSEAGKSLLKAIHSKTKQPAIFLKKSSDAVEEKEAVEQPQSQPQPQKPEEQPKINLHPEYITLLKDGIGNKGHSRDMWLKIVSWATAHLSQDIFLEFVDAQWRNEAKKMWDDLLKSSKHFSCPVYLLEKYAKEINPEFYRKWRAEHKRYLKVGILDKGGNDVAQFIAPKLSQTLVYCDAKWYCFNKAISLWTTTTKPDATVVSHIQQEIDEARELLLNVKNKSESEEEKKKLQKIEESYLKWRRDVAVGSYCSQLKNYLAQYLCNNEFKNKLDQMQYRAAYADGILDLKTLELRKGIKPDDYLTRKLDYNFNKPPQEDIDWVRETIKKICNYNEAHLEYYLSCLGYAMTGDSDKEQNFFYLRGQTAQNGKSVVFEALQKTAPIYVGKGVSTFLDEGADIKKEVASWRGLRILWVNELSPKKKNSELIKAICDGTFYKNNTNYAVVAELIAILFKMFCVSNNSLKIDADAGVKRRFKLLQFMSQFKEEYTKDDPEKKQFEQDKKLHEKLTGKYRDAFMYLIFTYSQKYAQKEELEPYPEEWQEEATETMAENDKFSEWFHSTFEIVEHIDVEKDEGVSKHEMESRLPFLLRDTNIKDNLTRLSVQFLYKSQETKKKRKGKGFFYGFNIKAIEEDTTNQGSIHESLNQA
jgi:hypothetical protein